MDLLDKIATGEIGNLLKAFVANARSRMDEILVEEHRVVEGKKEKDNPTSLL